MRRLDGGVFTMGTDRFYPEEAPARRVRIDPFWIDETPVTNAQFRAFAEIPPRAEDYPGLLPHLAHAGSLVFEPTSGSVPLDSLAWWASASARTSPGAMTWRPTRSARPTKDARWRLRRANTKMVNKFDA